VARLETMRNGSWQPLECVAAWDGDNTWANFVAFAWEARASRVIVAVNHSAQPSHCYVRLPWPDLAGQQLRLDDLMQPVAYDREGNDLVQRGLYLDVAGWAYHVFSVVALT
jgi:hypothetical protein